MSNENSNDVMQVPYIVYESAEAKHERTVKRLILALMLAIGLLFLSNALWLNAWMQYDYVGTDESSEITVDAGKGTANYIGNDGDITNGEDNSQEKKSDKSTDTDSK
jgi:hypothetical protein